MSTLLDAARLELQERLHRIRVLPIVIVYLNNICDSQCITCSIWKNNEALKIHSERQMPDAILEELYSTLGQWRPRQILISGGEPALHPRFAEAVKSFRRIAPQVCVITNGLLLNTFELAALHDVSEFYISFDAPDADGYRTIRGVDGFARLEKTMQLLRRLPHRPKTVARCTLQRHNVRLIPELIAAARAFGFDNISFLAVDVASTAFSRDVHGTPDTESMQPKRDDLAEMERQILALKSPDPFVEGGVQKLSRILRYFRGVLGDADFPKVECNAPWVSVVIETTGAIRGCFFQPVIGDFRNINGAHALRFRRELDVSNDPTCRRCVCNKLLGTRDFIRM
jgi:MoaA/NifB/PqqE/SkfB family radical SAM enzyme